MIEKIPKQNTWGQCLDKINELVDAVNEIKQYLDWDEISGKITQNSTNNVKNSHFLQGNDPYAEQRKWIGHLVEYGNADDGFKYGILTNIEPIYDAYPFEIDNGRDATADCWLPDESVFYKKEQQ